MPIPDSEPRLLPSDGSSPAPSLQGADHVWASLRRAWTTVSLATPSRRGPDEQPSPTADR
jgi:hypothetical protein